MKKGIITSLILGVFALMLFTSAVSAVITLSDSAPPVLPLTTGAQSFTINVTSDVIENVDLTATNITQNSKTIVFTPVTPSLVFLAPGTQLVTFNYNVPIDFNFNFGKIYSTTLLANGTVSPDIPKTVSFVITNPTESADDGNLDITIDDLSVENGFGPEDNEWYPLDTIKAKIEVENVGDEKIKNIVVEWGLYNKEEGKWVVSGEEDKFSLSDGADPKDLTVTFQVDRLSRITEDGGYVFYAWATGDDYVTDPTTETAVFDSEAIVLDFDSDFVVLDNVQIPETASCGGEIQITANVANIGSSDQNDVYVIFHNTELKIDEKVEVGDIDSLDSKSLDVTLTLPSDTAEKSYSLKMTIYNEDGEIYENDNDDKAQFNSELFRIEGGCVFNPQLKTSARLVSGGTAGQEMVVKVTVTNTDSVKRTFEVGVSSYDTWAELVSFTPETLELDADESAEVELKFNVKAGVEGAKTFSLDLTNANGKVIPQPVEVTVTKPGFSLFPGTGAVVGNKNWYVWAIGALNIVLVLIIILVAVRLVKK